LQVSYCHSSPYLAGGAWSLGPSNPIELYCPIYNRSLGRNRAIRFPQILYLFLRAICSDSILSPPCPPLQVVQISSTSASMAPEPWKLRYIIACDLAKACIYRQLLRPSMGCLLEALFFPILMASTVLKEILLLASVKLPQLALLGWGLTWSLGGLKLYCPIYNRSSCRNRTAVSAEL